MQLIENEHNQELSKIEAGDIITIITDFDKKFYFNVEQKNGDEILMSASNGFFKMYLNSAINGKSIRLYGKDNEPYVSKFKEIIIKNKDNTKNIRITPVIKNDSDNSNEEGDDSNQDDVSEKEAKIKEILAQQREQIASVFSSLKEGQEFVIMFGDIVEDEDGYNSGEYDNATEAIFRVVAINKGALVSRLLEVSGPKADVLDDYYDVHTWFSLDNNLFDFNDDGVSIVATNAQSSGPFNIEYVYYVDIEEGYGDEIDDEDDEGVDRKSNTKRVRQNKDLLKLLHHKTWKDHLFGRDGVGIIPSDNIRKRLGIENKTNQYIKFEINKDIKIKEGNNLWLKKDTEITGKMYNNDRIIVFSRNGREEIHLFLKKTDDPDIFNVKAQHVGRGGEKNELGKAKIKILD